MNRLVLLLILITLPGCVAPEAAETPEASPAAGPEATEGAAAAAGNARIVDPDDVDADLMDRIEAAIEQALREA